MTVAGGLFTSIIPARSAIAIHIGIGSGSGGGGGGAVPVAVTFQETATTTFGEVSREPRDSNGNSVDKQNQTLYRISSLLEVSHSWGIGPRILR